jgi:hypothetical protein
MNSDWYGFILFVLTMVSIGMVGAIADWARDNSKRYWFATPFIGFLAYMVYRIIAALVKDIFHNLQQAMLLTLFALVLYLFVKNEEYKQKVKDLTKRMDEIEAYYAHNRR